jgi:hypothetical protein
MFNRIFAGNSVRKLCLPAARAITLFALAAAMASGGEGTAWAGINDLKTAIDGASHTYDFNKNIEAIKLTLADFPIFVRPSVGSFETGSKASDILSESIDDINISLVNTHTSGLIPSALLGYMSTITGNYNGTETRTWADTVSTGYSGTFNTTVTDKNINTEKWLYFNNSGLSLSNLHFTNVKAEYTYAYSSAGGVVNGLIGNDYKNANAISMGDIKGNAFTEIGVTLHGYQDTHYWAGGGVIGLRSTSDSASIGDISGNVFSGVAVSADKAVLGTKSAYIEGGGVIGVDAVSSPAKQDGFAAINSLTNNFFTGVKVETGDIILGGGLIGLNNNSQNFNENTYVRLGNVSGNIFGNGSDGNILVSANYSLRGGGVIGLNGLSNAGVTLDSLTGNVFAGIKVESKTSYIRGGGIVGLQTNESQIAISNEETWEDIVKSKPENEDTNTPSENDYDQNDSDIVTILDPAVQALLHNASGNLFFNTQVSAGTYIDGGGIIGVRSNKSIANLTYLDNNIFKDLKVETKSGDLTGGGVVGLSAANWAGLSMARNNYFEDIHTIVSGDLSGGGVIGVSAAKGNPNNTSGSIINFLQKNTFKDIEVSARNLVGGGFVGAVTSEDFAGASDISRNFFQGSVITSSDLTGGGVIGFVASDDTRGYAFVTSADSNEFADINVNVSGDITGGGVLGVKAATYSYIGEVSGDTFKRTKITASGDIKGGGVIGLTGGKNSSTIGRLENNIFSDVEVEAQSIIGGGFIGGTTDNGTASAKMISGLIFYNGNTVKTTSGDLTGGGVIGLVGKGSSGIARIDEVNNNWFSGLEITVDKDIIGGGVLGTVSDKESKIGTISNNTFAFLDVTAGGHIDGGGIIGVTSKSSNLGTSAGIGLIDNSLFAGNIVKSTGASGEIMGGLVYSYGLSGGMTIRDSHFFNNTFEAPTGGKVYGAVTVDTGANGASEPHKLTLTASNGGRTYFTNNEIFINGNSEGYNSLYFGKVYDSINGVHDDPEAHAELVIDAKSGGSVELYDPIEVNQTASTNNGTYGFKMTVLGSGGQFLWGGANKFDVDATTTTEAEYKSITLENGSLTKLKGGYNLFHNSSNPEENHTTFKLTARDFSFNLNSGAWMQVQGSNVMDLDRAALKGDINFLISDKAQWMPQSTAMGNNDNFLLQINTVKTNSENVTDINGATVSLSTLPGDLTLTPGKDVFPLLATDDEEELQGDTSNNTAYARQSLTKGYNFKIDKVGPDPSGAYFKPNKFFFAYLINQEAAHEARTLTEGRAAALGFLRASWLPDHSYQQADLALYQEGTYKSWVPFAGIDGAWAKVDTGGGGEYEVSGVNGLLGVAREYKKPGESLLTGFFVEAGYAGYDTDNRIWHDPYYIDMHGDGTLRSIGGGVMLRREWSNGVRLEGSFRAGQIRNKFHSGDYIDTDTGLAADYELTVPYYAAHVGLARAWMLNEHRRLDIIGRYFWARQEGKGAVLPNGEIVDFDTDDSHRVRLGGRMTFIRDERREWYLGVSGEYELAGGANGSAGGYELDSPTLKGFTGIGELGWIFRSTKDDDFSFETGLQGYIGRMRGISGGVRMEWRF